MKVLIVSYYWPPAGGPGVQRWLKFVKYLPEFGIEPIVYIPENPNYPIIDQELTQEVPNEVQILKGKIIEPYGLAAIFSKKKIQTISSGLITKSKKQSFFEKWVLWIRGNLFIPDARLFWVRPSVTFLEQYIRENDIQTVITTGPPHSLHLIGLGLKKRFPTISWMADFRDPWTTIGYHKELKLSDYAQKKHLKLESDVLNTADKIIVTSYCTQRELEQITSKPIEVITNGFDTQDFTQKIMDTKFSLAHIGSFLSDRNPHILWEVLQEMCSESLDFKQNLQLTLVGRVSDEILSAIDAFGLSENVLNLGYVSHQKAQQIQKNTQVLLLIEIDSPETKGIIPGKFFEYMVSNRPIVALGPQNSDVEQLIQSTNTGTYFLYHQKEALKQQLQAHYKAYLEGNLTVNAVGVQKFSRKKLTEQLVEFIKK